MLPKFRVWDKSINYMDYRVRVTSTDNYMKVEVLDSFTYWREIEGNQYDLMQSTGLFDKYSVEIFEGDIVIDTVGPQIKMVVKWIDDCAAFRTVGTYEGENFVGYVGHETKFGKNTCQVIGNIYENKEMLK